MIEMLLEEGAKKTFIIRATKAIRLRKNSKQKEELDSLYIYQKSDKTKESIGIVKAGGKIKMKIISEEGPRGIKVETNKEADVGSVELDKRIVFFLTEKE